MSNSETELRIALRRIDRMEETFKSHLAIVGDQATLIEQLKEENKQLKEDVVGLVGLIGDFTKRIADLEEDLDCMKAM